MTTTAALGGSPLLDAPLDDLPTADELVRAAVRWHFDPATGSPFWLRRAATLGFAPLTEVTGRADLARFPDVSVEWRTVPVEDLVPRGTVGRAGSARIYESGGTTGAPKRIVELGYWQRTADWTSVRLDLMGFPRGGNWLYLGPTGPHVAGRLFTTLARQRGGSCFTVDFDPRWVRRCAQEGRSEEVERYLAHLVDQARWVLESQQVQILWATPPVLSAMAADRALTQLIRDRVGGILWSGTSADPETLHLLEHEVFPGIPFAGIYGNTLMGVAPQRPGRPDDPSSCVFQPFHPHVLIDLLDPLTGAETHYGERGQVRLHHLSRDLFLPGIIERDLATRVRPAPGENGDGLADVRPLPSAGRPIVEGVY
ncbi:phenazine biosynthesis protein [Streptomyces enissocaesilis]|uniref:AMP-binding protein n=1 Tax=Streptomyces enissocaesilis TaxID=332589 RepID=A0ABN3X714_9ACTN